MREVKLADISTEVQEVIYKQCQCHIDTDIIDEESFACFDLVDSVTYRARLGGTAEQNSTALISLIKDWVATGPAIKIYGVLMKVNQNCAVIILDFNDNECTKPDGTASQSDDNALGILTVVGSLLGGISTILTLIGMIATCVSCIYKRLK